MSAPGNERLLQTGQLNVHVGGAEANVGVSLAQFGHDVDMVSTIAANALGDAATGELRRYGVSTDKVSAVAGRMGMYFLSTGAVRRPSSIVYDRAGSAFALAPRESYDWRSLLAGASWLHISGITPAVGAPCTAAALDAVAMASELGVKVSFDGNYRALLWEQWEGDGPAILGQLLSHASLAFINERDLRLIFGADCPAERADAYTFAFERLPRLEMIAATTRDQSSVSDHDLGGELVSRTGRWVSPVHELRGIVDRIGGGDAFAAGVLHGCLSQSDPQQIINFATAAAAIKHSIPGDFNLATVKDVADAMGDGGLDVRR